MELRWARSATRHRVSRARSRHVVDHFVWAGRERADPKTAGTDERLVFLGDDADGVAIEVMAVELPTGGLLVIHAMPLREKYQQRYEESK